MGVPYKVFYRLGSIPGRTSQSTLHSKRSYRSCRSRGSGREPPYGPALDLGCGSAVWGVPLAKRGWQVTGVDNVDKALERARERVQKAGVDDADRRMPTSRLFGRRGLAPTSAW